MKASDIIYQTSNYHVVRAPYGFDVYRNEGTGAVRCARIGYKGDKGLQRAKDEIAKRDLSAA